MSKPSRVQERLERQAAELLAIIQMLPRASTAELASRTGMSHGLVIKRLAVLEGEGIIVRNRDLAKSVSATARGLSLDQRVSTLERLLERDIV
jgi:DNA-binding MarR family transcriptional regulator